MIEINLQPDDVVVNGRHLHELIRLYLDDRRPRVKTVTIVGYSFCLKVFGEWWAEVGPQREWALTRTTLADYGQWLQHERRTRWGKPLEIQGCIDNLRRLRQLLIWAHRGHYLPIDISSWVVLPTKPRQPKPPIPAGVLPAMMEAADLTPFPQRNRALIAFIAGTGCRLHEVANIQVSDLTVDADSSGTAYVRHAKAGRSRYVAFNRVTGRYLCDYLDLVDWPPGPLFGMGDKGIYYVVSRAADAAAVRHIIRGPHDLRRLFITHWTTQQPGSGYALLLSRQVGHSSYAVTEMYARLGIEDIRAHFVSPLQPPE